MAQCVVIADDLTGGNATGVLLRKMGYEANTVLNLAAVDPDLVQGGDCVVYPTDSRGISPEEAYGRVRKACGILAGDGVKIYTHRIDSTLRGNVIFDRRTSIGSISEPAMQFSSIGDNAVYPLDKINAFFEDAPNGDYRIRDSAKIQETVPGFREIPLSRIGRIAQ